MWFNKIVFYICDLIGMTPNEALPYLGGMVGFMFPVAMIYLSYNIAKLNLSTKTIKNEK